MKYYIGQIDERNGEREYNTTVKFLGTDDTAGEVPDRIAAHWYSDEPDESTGDGYHFSGGEVCVNPGSYDEIPKEMYEALPAFIAELTGTEHGA